jgi:hypothetical protein
VFIDVNSAAILSPEGQGAEEGGLELLTFLE